MRSVIPYLPAVLALCVSAGASAQVYESKDAEGNVSFSDTPTQGAEQVQVEPTNTVEAVDPNAYPEQSQESTPSQPTIRVVGDQSEMPLNEGRRVILDSDEYERGMADNPREKVVPYQDVETDLVDDQGREINPKADMPYEGIHVEKQSGGRNR